MTENTPENTPVLTKADFIRHQGRGWSVERLIKEADILGLELKPGYISQIRNEKKSAGRVTSPVRQNPDTRSRETKMRAVKLILSSARGSWPDYKIAQVCRVTIPLVNMVRIEQARLACVPIKKIQPDVKIDVKIDGRSKEARLAKQQAGTYKKTPRTTRPVKIDGRSKEARQAKQQAGLGLTQDRPLTPCETQIWNGIRDMALLNARQVFETLLRTLQSKV